MTSPSSQLPVDSELREPTMVWSRAQVIKVPQSWREVAVELALKFGLTILTTWISVKLFKQLLNPVDKAGARAKADLCRRLHIQPKQLDLTSNELSVAVNVFAPDELDVDLAEVAGCDHIVNQLKRDILFQLMHPRLACGALMGSATGVLLYGPAGVGKSMLIKAVARFADCILVSIKASTLYSKWFGESNQNVRAVFTFSAKLAALGARVLIYLDEVDALLGESANSGGNETHEQVKTEFMQHWDAIVKIDSVVVIAATNRPERLNDAIWRRFSHHFELPLPDEKGRVEVLRRTLEKHVKDSRRDRQLSDVRLIDACILKDDATTCPPSSFEDNIPSASKLAQACHLSKAQVRAILLEPTPPLQRIAKLTAGYSGCDLVKLCTAAVRLCCEQLYERITASSAAADRSGAAEPRFGNASGDVKALYQPLCEEFFLRSLLSVKAAATTRRGDYLRGDSSRVSLASEPLVPNGLDAGASRGQGLEAFLSMISVLDPGTLRVLAAIKEGTAAVSSGL